MAKIKPELDAITGENDPRVTEMPSVRDASDTATVAKWMAGIDTRFANMQGILEQLQHLPEILEQAQHTVDLRVAAMVAKEQLGIMVDAATAGVMKGTGKELARWRGELNNRMSEQRKELAISNNKQRRFVIIIGVIVVVACIIIKLLL